MCVKNPILLFHTMVNKIEEEPNRVFLKHVPVFPGFCFLNLSGLSIRVFHPLPIKCILQLIQNLSFFNQFLIQKKFHYVHVSKYDICHLVPRWHLSTNHKKNFLSFFPIFELLLQRQTSNLLQFQP